MFFSLIFYCFFFYYWLSSKMWVQNIGPYFQILHINLQSLHSIMSVNFKYITLFMSFFLVIYYWLFCLFVIISHRIVNSTNFNYLSKKIIILLHCQFYKWSLCFIIIFEYIFILHFLLILFYKFFFCNFFFLIFIFWFIFLILNGILFVLLLFFNKNDSILNEKHETITVSPTKNLI